MPARASSPSSAVDAFAWGGGLAFVASLTWFVYFYYRILGHRSAPRETLVPHLVIDLLLFTAFAAHHSLFARERAKRFVTKWIPPTLERSTYVWIASTLFMMVCLAWQPVPGGELYRAGPSLAWLIRAAHVLGLLVIIRAATVLDPLDLAGIRQAHGIPGAPSSRVEIAGPYRWVRHPLYAGWMLFVFSSPTMTVDRLTFATISSAYLLLAIPWEERSLAASLGEPYRAYTRQVRWRLVPYVY